MSRPVTMVSAQVRPVTFDPIATLEKFEREVRTIVEAWPETHLIVFPELYLTGDDPFTGASPEGFVEDVATPIPGPLSERVAEVARTAGTAVVAGTIFECDGDIVYNTALVFASDGALVATHRKLVPWQPWESVCAGGIPTVCDLPGIGRVGIMTCYDGWFPEVARALALQGAELIVQPSLTSTPDRAEELVIARANALFNQCFVVNVNASLTVGGGRSIGVDPEGRVLFQAGDGEELIPDVVDLERVSLVRRFGTRGLNRVWTEVASGRLPFWDAYRELLDRGS
ncbi:MAG: carbon-nitrogen hydrolase family protein [Actinomycetota bacterium]